MFWVGPKKACLIFHLYEGLNPDQLDAKAFWKLPNDAFVVL